MKKMLALLGLGAACVVCCTVPFALPAMAATVGASALGAFFNSDTVVCGLAPVLAVAAVWRWRVHALRSRALAASNHCRVDGSCGCASSSAPKG